MKCPGCGNELGTDSICSKCGFNHAGNKDEIEVEYKDFKTSEFLEIRQKRQAASHGKGTEGKLKIRVSDKATSDTRKNSVPVSAVIVLILMLISCLFILFRYLVQR